MYGVIDRIEESIAVIEFDNGKIENITLENIKGEAKEGDVLLLKNGLYFIDKEETNKRKKEAESFLNLWE